MELCINVCSPERVLYTDFWHFLLAPTTVPLTVHTASSSIHVWSVCLFVVGPWPVACYQRLCMIEFMRGFVTMHYINSQLTSALTLLVTHIRSLISITKFCPELIFCCEMYSLILSPFGSNLPILTFFCQIFWIWLYLWVNKNINWTLHESHRLQIVLGIVATP